MDVAVNQAGKDRLVSIIHLLNACTLGSGDSFLGADLSNRVAFEEDCRSFLDRTSRSINQSCGLQNLEI